jgi:hypothetical protein
VNLSDYCAHADQCAAQADFAPLDVRDAWLGLKKSFRFLAQIEQRIASQRGRLNPTNPANLRDWGT